MGDEQSQLTEWIEKRKSPDKKMRDEAQRRIEQAWRDRLLREIERQVPQRVRSRFDADEVLQTAMRSFLEGDPSFDNRYRAFAYLLKLATHKAANLRRFHEQKERDVRREVPFGDEDSSESGYGGPRFNQGAKPVPHDMAARRPYRRRVDRDQDKPRENDSFFDDEMLKQMVWAEPPDQVAIVRELFEILQAHDRENDDFLHEIAVGLWMEGLGTEEIAEKLKVQRRTVERSRDVIAELWRVARAVRLRVLGGADQLEDRAVVILPRTTATQLLSRLELVGYRLVRDLGGTPGHRFAPADGLWNYLVEGDLLLAEPVDVALPSGLETV